MDSPGLTGKVEVERTDNDPCMMRRRCMQADEVLTIEREQCSDVRGREKKDRLVCDRLPRLTSVGDCHHVVSEATQFLNNGEWEVLVSEEARHCDSSGFVLADLRGDLLPM